MNELTIYESWKLDLDSRAWKLLIESIQDAKKLADSIGAKLMVVHFPHRSMIYYPILMGKDVAGDYIERLEISELDRLSKSMGYEFLSLAEPLTLKMLQLEKSGSYTLDDLPYFAIDGHMSPLGTRWSADLIAQRIKEIGLLR